VLTEATGPNPGCYQEKENIISPLFFIICPLFLKKSIFSFLLFVLYLYYSLSFILLLLHHHTLNAPITAGTHTGEGGVLAANKIGDSPIK